MTIYLDFKVPEHHVGVDNELSLAPHLLSPAASPHEVALYLHLVLASTQTYHLSRTK